MPTGPTGGTSGPSVDGVGSVVVLLPGGLDQPDQAVLVHVLVHLVADAGGEDQGVRCADHAVAERDAPQAGVDQRLSGGVLQGALELPAAAAEDPDQAGVDIADQQPAT